MNDPKRLRDGDTGVAKLLQAATADGLSASGRAQVAAAVGVSLAGAAYAGAAAAASTAGSAIAGAGGGTLGTTAGAAATAGAAVTVAGAAGPGAVANLGSAAMAAGATGAAAGVASAGGSVVAGKLALLVALGGGAVGTGFWATAADESAPSVAQTDRGEAPRESREVTTRKAEGVPAPEGAKLAPTATEPEQPPTASEQRPRSSRRVRATGGEPTGRTAEEGSSLLDEVQAIDQIRSHLAGGDPSKALRQLARFEARFPSGRFSSEAQVLRIEALAASGERAQAQELARAYLQAHPKSPYQARLAPIAER